MFVAQSEGDGYYGNPDMWRHTSSASETRLVGVVQEQGYRQPGIWSEKL